jgi:preprotein translocase subunit SecA
MARQDKEDFIYKTTREKFNVIEDVTQLSKAGRPVLIGTLLLRFLNYCMLKMRGVSHNVLNAKMHKQEAQIVEAGKSRCGYHCN